MKPNYKETFLKQFSISLIFIFMGAITGHSQQGWEEQGLNGKVKTIRSYTYDVEEENGEIIKKDLAEFGVGLYNEFNEEGKVIKWIRYRDGRVEESGIYEYDSMGNKIRMTKFDADGELLYSTVFNFEYENDKVISEEVIILDTPSKSLTLYKYDKDGNLISSETYENDKLNVKVQNSYNELNQLIEKSSTEEGRSHSTHYTYDDSGLLIEEVLYHPNGEFIMRIDYTYDSNGNLIKDRASTESGHSPGFIEYTYDEENNMIKKHTLTYFNGEGLIEEFDKYGNEIRKYKTGSSSPEYIEDFKYSYKFDEMNNWIEQLTYEFDKPVVLVVKEIEYFD